MNALRTAFALVAILLAAAAPAAAQSKTQAAREASENGRRAYNLNHWDEAIAAFEKAYQLSGDPALLFNLAQAHRQAGHGNEALHFYKVYLREQPDGPNREIAEKQLNELQAQNWHDPFDTPDPAGKASPAPAARPVAPPTAPPPARSTVTAVPPAPSPAPAAPAASTTDAPVLVSPPEPAPPPRRTPLPRWLPLAGAVASVALMSAAVVYSVSASNRYDELASSCGRAAPGCTDSDIDGVRSRDRTATALWIATGVVATGTGVAAVVNARAAGVSALWRF